MAVTSAFDPQHLKISHDDTVEVILAEQYDFQADGTVTVTFEGGEPRTATWQFADNETKIAIDADELSQTLDILTLEEDLFRFQFETSDVTVTATLVHP